MFSIFCLFFLQKKKIAGKDIQSPEMSPHSSRSMTGMYDINFCLVGMVNSTGLKSMINQINRLKVKNKRDRDRDRDREREIQKNNSCSPLFWQWYLKSPIII